MEFLPNRLWFPFCLSRPVLLTKYFRVAKTQKLLVTQLLQAASVLAGKPSVEYKMSDDNLVCTDMSSLFLYVKLFY